MIPGTQAYVSDGEGHEKAAISRADQVQRNNALRNTIWFGVQGRKDSSAAIKLHSSIQGNQCMKTGNSGGKNFTMRCATWVKRDREDETDDRVPWPKGHEQWSNVRKSRFRNKFWFTDHWEASGGCMFSVACCRYSDGEGDWEWRISHDSELSHNEDCQSGANITCAEVLSCKGFRDAVQSGHCITEKQMRTVAEKCIGNYGQVNKHTLWRAKRMIKQEDKKFYKDDFLKMPYWNAAYVHRNTTSFIASAWPLHVFKSQFLVCGPFVHVASHCGLKFAAIDTCFSRHWAYNGKIWVLATRDSNNKICVPCYGMSPEEDNFGVAAFANTCQANAHLVDYLKGAVLYSDGGPCMPQFVGAFEGMVHK